MNDLPDPDCAGNISSSLWHILRNVKEMVFSASWRRRAALKVITEMRLDNHPSGYPDPDAVSALAYHIRQQKFQLVRERGRGTTEEAEIQSMIDALKKMQSEALRVRPRIGYAPTWCPKGPTWRYTGIVDGVILILMFFIPLLQIIFAVSLSVRTYTLCGLTVLIILEDGRSHDELTTRISMYILIFFLLPTILYYLFFHFPPSS